MYSDRQYLLSRRSFLKTALGGALAWHLAGCGPADELAHVRGGMVNQDAATGHLLRNPAAIPPATGPFERAEIVIIGGGISGLSALRWLKLAGVKDVVLLELEGAAGGNSAWGKNSVSSYPWAAHYLPIPDVRNTELLSFLDEAGCITGYRDNLPVYNEFHLCAAPGERLFINGYWQEGIVPETGISSGDEMQIRRFLQLADELKAATGADGKPVFTIPLDKSSADPLWRSLDKISFSDYLDQQNFKAAPLRWYLDYCCKDDYGLTLQQTSAWAGLHYFASRKGRSANAQPGDVLTWPEGNGFIMEALRQPWAASVRTRQAAFKVEPGEAGVLVHTYNSRTKSSSRMQACKVIMAVPQFVAARLLPPAVGCQAATAPLHTPWLVANLTLRDLPQAQGQGIGLCWDNVIYNSPSVGYVHAGHQLLAQAQASVITYYKPLLDAPPGKARSAAMAKTWKAWLKEIVADLSEAHPGIARNIVRADVRVWGHGMAGPQPGLIWGGAREAMSAPIDGQIFFAHTDYCGISLFEEAFYQGIDAARNILATA
jgi:phytoene dehydrogenase-like protein